MLSKIHKPEVLIHLITDQSNHFPHGKCRQHCSNSKSVDMSQDQSGHTGSNRQADHIKETLTLEYFTFIISDSSRGNRSVGMIGRPHLLESEFLCRSADN